MAQHRGIETINDIRKRCVIDAETGCWLWRGAVNSQGTPVTFLPMLDAPVSLGIAICALTTGAKPAVGRIWYPICRNALCGNPSHRTIGTRSDVTKGTRTPAHTAKIALARRARSKLTEQSAAEIRDSTEKLVIIAARYGISPSQASRIRRGELWRPLGAPGCSVFHLKA